jgi:hypothetical protein
VMKVSSTRQTCKPSPISRSRSHTHRTRFGGSTTRSAPKSKPASTFTQDYLWCPLSTIWSHQAPLRERLGPAALGGPRLAPFWSSCRALRFRESPRHPRALDHLRDGSSLRLEN